MREQPFVVYCCRSLWVVAFLIGLACTDPGHASIIYFSTTSTATVDGQTFLQGDVVEYDTVTGAAALAQTAAILDPPRPPSWFYPQHRRGARFPAFDHLFACGDA